MEVVASLSQDRTAAAQCGLFTHKSVPVIFEPPCMLPQSVTLFEYLIPVFLLGDHRQTLPEAVLTLVAIFHDLTHKEINIVTALQGTKEAQCHALFFFYDLNLMILN